LGQNPKPSVCSSISDVPCETAMLNDGGRWWVWVDSTEAPAPRCGLLFSQKVSLNSESLSPNPSNVAPVDVRCFFMAGVDECVVAKDERLDGLRL
jgi:hypothetical protein